LQPFKFSPSQSRDVPLEVRNSWTEGRSAPSIEDQFRELADTFVVDVIVIGHDHHEVSGSNLFVGELNPIPGNVLVGGNPAVDNSHVRA
jgi:hypothetical protein